MDINVFIVCFNESVILPHTINHYKNILPSCKITVYDNQSTDDSVKIAENLGCTVIDWNTDGITNEFKLQLLKNNCWKCIEKGWIIMADMDEFLYVTEDDLIKEMESGVSILNVKGYDMIGESKTEDLSDIDLQKINKSVDNPNESKKLCFLREKINDINYGIGAHFSYPEGDVVYSTSVYINKHMNILGLPFYTNRIIERCKRSEYMRSIGFDGHYISDIEEIKTIYLRLLNSSETM